MIIPDSIPEKRREFIIYKITNLVNGKIYIGQTKRDINIRMADHVKRNKYYVQRSLNKYGLESFAVSIIDEADTKRAIDEKEIHWIKFYNCRSPRGYNCTKGGDGNDNPRSAETREKVRLANLGEKHPFYGKHHSVESNQKRRLALLGPKNHNYGKDFSGANNPSYGKHRSIETKLKMRKPRSQEGCANIKASLTPDVIAKRVRSRIENALKLKTKRVA